MEWAGVWISIHSWGGQPLSPQPCASARSGSELSLPQLLEPLLTCEVNLAQGGNLRHKDAFFGLLGASFSLLSGMESPAHTPCAQGHSWSWALLSPLLYSPRPSQSHTELGLNWG